MQYITGYMCAAAPYTLAMLSFSTSTVLTSTVLRDARPNDARAIIALQESIYQERLYFVGDGPPSLETLTRRLRSLDGEQELYLVATGRDGALGGWLELHRFPMSRMRHVALLTVAVAQSYRRQGLGRRLMERAYVWARRVGVKKVQLNVRASNRAAIALYEEQGFVIEGLERAQVRDGNVFEDNLIMAKFL